MKIRTVIYGVVFSIASYASAAALALSIGAYAISSFTDPIVTLTIPLILLSIGLQAMNEKFSVLLLTLINAVLYAATGLLFMVPTLVIAGVIDEIITWFVGFRSFKAVMINTTVVGTLVGILSVIFGIMMVGLIGSIPFKDLALAYLIFTIIYLVESAIMGLISYKLGSYLLKSGIIKG
ncbi:hypothetical protein [Sulfurisphaera ohwakuensis]|uniref:Uncharacterized protein n=1 Tax=Sulfurisphaera ohwakuensis TaxID=69656 RepID=A0A650CHZ1_SULOH|nr:hypothetical protein [Sulfurisphaera ohwakuensis]MBB5253557.1 hypothetical protein [Sulfurisphaera ohwakuensis]QGR17422.1 hypothetical protein D1869_09595 [Sulfurisphaera ohwakuensis]